MDTYGAHVNQAPLDQNDFEAQIVDYWGFEEIKRFTLPDGIQYIEHKVLTEGDKARYQKNTSRDMSISRNTGEAKIKTDPGADRQALLMVAVTGWKMYRGRDPQTGAPAEVPFNKTGKNPALEQWLNGANPRIVEDLERDIRKANPWLMGDMTVEDIDREIESLQEMRVVAEEREAGNASSGSK